MLRHALTASAAVLVLSLAACDDGNQTAQNQAPAQTAPADPAPSTENSAEEAARKLREAGEALTQAAREGATNLAEQGREALENAGPALDRATEVAKQLGQSIDEIMARARRDFDTAIVELQKRIDESGSNIEAPTSVSAATLAPADTLKADTRAAARARPAGIGPAYVGVWAQDAATCARIDVDPVEMFAVITPTTIRRYESVCNFEAVEPTDGSATVAASCIAEGEAEDRQIAFAMDGENSLKISTPNQPGEADLVRCSLPQ